MEPAARLEADARPRPSLAAELEAGEKAAAVLHELLDGLYLDLGPILAPEVEEATSPSTLAAVDPHARAAVVSQARDLWTRVDHAASKVEHLRKRLQLAPR